MRITKAAVAVAILAAGSPVFAQSSVTLSGLMDAGVSYLSNQGGHSNVKFDDGIGFPNLLEFSGREDLGGGNAAIFQLTDQYSVGTGSTLPGQGLFGRTAIVGVDSQTWGRLTFGNQMDFMVDSLMDKLDDGGVLYAGGLYDFRNGPFSKLALPDNPTGAYNWDRMAGTQVANSVKYLSPSYKGFSGGAMYGFGGVAGSIGSNNATSFGLNYANGPFGANAAYTNVKSEVAGAEASVRNWGLGTHYNFGKFTTTALFTTVHNSANGGEIWEGEVATLYRINPFWGLGGSYMYMKGNAEVDNNHAHQLSAMLSYFLSKRTTVYVTGVYQRANEGAHPRINAVFDEDGASSGQNQIIARVGFQTRF